MHTRLPRLAAVSLFAAVLLSACGAPMVAQNAAVGDAAAQREDLGVFEQKFFAVDRSYSATARTEAAQRLAVLAASIGTISDIRFVLSLCQIVALADNGHSNVTFRGNGRGMGRVGIRLVSFGGDFFVLHAAREHAGLLGSRLVAIDGTPVVRLRESARTLVGGVPAWRDLFAPSLFESPGQLHAMGLARSATEARYTFALRDGSAREVALAIVADPPGLRPPQTAGVLEPFPAASGWNNLLASDRAPWALRDFGDLMRRRDAPEFDAMVIQLRTNFNDPQPISSFLDAAEAERRAAGRKNVILDMRMNAGGDLELTREWMSALPGRLPTDGRVVVLSGPWTFSAAISNFGYLKQAGGARVILAGEPPGDRLRFWTEGRPFALPHSGAMVQTATRRHDYRTGCSGYTDCHAPVVRYPIALETFDPEISAPWTIESYAAGRDPGMEAAAALLAKPR